MVSGTSGAMSTSNTYVKYTISIVENSTNISNNTSNVTVSVRFYRTNSGYSTYGTGTVYCAINGISYSATVSPTQKITSSGIVLFSKTLDISHDSNGSKTLDTAAYITHDAPLSSNSQSYSLALSTIPRASSLSVSDGILGSRQTITADRKASSFTHTLTWTCGDYSGTICSMSSDASWLFTPDIKLAEGAPYGVKVYCSFTLTTYNGSTNVGSDTKGVWYTIPDTVKPECTIELSDAYGYASTYGGYISGVSSLDVTINATPAYGSPIQSYSSEVNGVTYTYSSFYAPVVYKPGVGTNTITVTVTDGRGRSGSNERTVSVLDYAKPSIQLTVHRCDEDGTENLLGKHAKITYDYSITSLSNKNTKTITLYYKKTSESVWTNVTLSTTDEVYSATNQTKIIPADDAHAYDIKISATDAFATTSVSTKLSTGYCLYHIPASGNGITFGGVADTDGFNVKMDAHFTNGFTEDIPVLDSGDCNTILKSGNYYIGNNGTNKPAKGANGWLTVKVYGDYNAYQHYITYSGIEYQRMLLGGTWQPWCGVRPFTVTTTVSASGLAAGKSTDAYAGDEPTVDGYVAIRIGGYGNGDIVSVAPNGWVFNHSDSYKGIESVTWIWLMLPNGSYIE